MDLASGPCRWVILQTLSTVRFVLTVETIVKERSPQKSDIAPVKRTRQGDVEVSQKRTTENVTRTHQVISRHAMITALKKQTMPSKKVATQLGSGLIKLMLIF